MCELFYFHPANRTDELRQRACHTQRTNLSERHFRPAPLPSGRGRTPIRPPSRFSGIGLRPPPPRPGRPPRAPPERGEAGFLPSGPGVASGCPGFEPGDPSPAAAVRLARGTPSSAPGVSPQPCRCRFPVRILRRDARRHKVRRNRYEKLPGNRPYRFFGFDCGSKVRIFHFFSLYWHCNV